MAYFILTLLLLLCDPRLIDQSIAICTAHTDGLHSTYIQTPRHLKFLGTRVAYYSNATSTLQLDILTSGDVNPNPGPEVCVNKTITELDYRKITYTPDKPDKLKALNNSSYSLCTNVVDCLKQLGIKHRRTHRGIRGGRRKIRKQQQPLTMVIPPTYPTDLQNMNLKWMCFNAQSCRQIVNDLFEIIVENNLDILMLTETWLYEQGDEAYITAMTPPGYTCHSFPRGARGGGIAFIIKACLSENITCTCLDYTSFESAELKLTINQTSAIYVPLPPSPWPVPY